MRSSCRQVVAYNVLRWCHLSSSTTIRNIVARSGLDSSLTGPPQIPLGPGFCKLVGWIEHYRGKPSPSSTLLSIISSAGTLTFLSSQTAHRHYRRAIAITTQLRLQSSPGSLKKSIFLSSSIVDCVPGRSGRSSLRSSSVLRVQLLIL